MGKAQEISAREAAQRLGLRLDSFYQLVWVGKIPARKSDGRWLIPATAIEGRLKNREEKNNGTTSR